MTTTELDNLSKKARKRIISWHYAKKQSHIGSSLSVIDILIHLYFNIKKENDVVILSKGHASSALYITLKMKGFKLPNDLPEHPDRSPEQGIFCSTGSLGHGLSIGCGVALARPKDRVFVVLSDGELNEGSTWEAVMFANQHHITNLIALVDYNGYQACGRCEDIIYLPPFGKMVINGNSHQELNNFFTKNQDTFVFCKTIKGKGVSFMENSCDWHYKIPTFEETKQALKELC